jgi:hypothetical protein
MVRHGVLDRPDPHRVDDKARLLAQIEMDGEIQELRNRQQQKQVLDKPNLQNNLDGRPSKSKKSTSSSSSSNRPAQAPARKIIRQILTFQAV